jgi:hypothetical protein
MESKAMLPKDYASVSLISRAQTLAEADSSCAATRTKGMVSRHRVKAKNRILRIFSIFHDPPVVASSLSEPHDVGAL